MTVPPTALALVLMAAAIWLSRGPATRRREADGSGALASHPRIERRRPSLPLVAAVTITAGWLALTGLVIGLAGAALLGPAVFVAVTRLLDRQRRAPPEWELAWLPLIVELVAAGLRSGQPLEAALAGAAPSQLPWLGGRLRQVAGMLRLGADPAQAWAPLADEPRLVPLVTTGIRSATSGIRLAAQLGELAGELRAQAHAEAQSRAQRVGVWVIAPLGLCFLPAFVCLSIVAVIIGLAASLPV